MTSTMMRLMNNSSMQEKGKGGAANLERMLLPLSSLSGWGLTAVGALMVIHVLGFNIQPLLTVGGVGGLAFGFGAQAVTSNAISGLNLFLTRPFVVGGKQGPSSACTPLASSSDSVSQTCLIVLTEAHLRLHILLAMLYLC